MARSREGDWIFTSEGDRRVLNGQTLAATIVQQACANKATVIGPNDESALRAAVDGTGLPLTMQVVHYPAFLAKEKQLAFKPPVFDELRDELVSEHDNARKDRRLSVEIIRLKSDKVGSRGLGDAILFTFPDGRLLLIDSGNDRAALAEIERLATASRPGDGTIPLDVLITHEHRDHTTGLRLLIKSLLDRSWTPIRLGQVLLGTHQGQDQSRLATELRASELFEERREGPALLRFENRDSTSDGKSTPLKLRSVRVTAGVRHITCDDVGGVRLELFQLDAPVSANQSSVVLRLKYRGVTQLFTGDLDIGGITVLVNSGMDIRADILKYPHHVSFPKGWRDGDRETMRRFLRVVNPHTVSFSNFGSHQGYSMEAELKEFIADVLDDDRTGLKVQFETTNDVKDGAKVIEGKTRARHVDYRRMRRHGVRHAA